MAGHTAERPWPQCEAAKRHKQERRERTVLPRTLAVALLTLSLTGGVSSLRAADISVTSGTTVVNSAADLGGNDVIVDNSGNLGATLQVNSAATLSNGITLNNGGTLDNSGIISRGVTGDVGNVINQTGGAITSTGDNGIYFSLGGIVTNKAGATISGINGIYSDWPSSQTGTVTNSGIITGTTDNGIDLENGGTVTNQAGGKISGAANGVLLWGGTITNTGIGSQISGTANGGVNLADVSTLINTNGARITGVDGVDAFSGSSVTNSNGATIFGTQSGVYTAAGESTVINTGNGSSITGGWVGAYLNDGGTLRNENGAVTASTGTIGGGAAVYLYSGGTVINGAGSNITGNSSAGIYGIYGSGNSSTISNAGTITGDVRLSDYFSNTVTLFTGGRINGDLYINGDSGSKLTLDGSGRQIYSEAVAGLTIFVGGVLTKQGSGTWVIDKDVNIFTPSISPGSTIIKAGTLEVDATLPGTVTVQGGGTLAGTGKVRATTVQSGGTVAPGRDGIGTLNVNGNFIQQAGSVYSVEANPASVASDRIAVTGAVTLSGGATLSIAKTSAVPYLVGTRYTVLTATGNITGTYTLTGNPSAFLGLTASYNTHNVYLDVVQSRTLAQAGATRTQFAIANSLQALPASNPLFTAIVNLPTDAAARSAFDQLSGELHGSIAGAMLEDSRFVRNAALGRLADTNCGTPATVLGRNKENESPTATMSCTRAGERITIWGSAFGSWGRNSNAPLDRTVGGFFAGADMPVRDTWHLGVLTGYSQTRINTASGTGTSDNTNLGVYGGTEFGRLAVRLGGVHTWHDISTSRAIAFTGYSDRLIADYGAATAQVFGELGYRIAVGGATIEPFANLAYVNVRNGGFAEAGGPGALVGHAGDNSVTFSTLGVHTSADFTLGGVRMFARETFGWRHAFGDVTPVSAVSIAGGSAFGVNGVPVQQDAAVLDVSLGMRLAGHVTLAASYVGQFASQAVDQGAKAHLNIKF
ncbi:outer membrane autotransporter barrel domain-containing protein [Afipia clevelandensis ATCC 49720]|uniref:Outer membrane autotransporter barrel domain-containing protein n=1 Tax=Afipia clevelandensis ATCC 49720 TaxID=883079 RepID=K8PKJ0_9BRAD|nr:outer membrane autotransporter barrel domain-containing protein [Afipia clevelandensis ATCC 49720]